MLNLKYETVRTEVLREDPLSSIGVILALPQGEDQSHVILTIPFSMSIVLIETVF